MGTSATGGGGTAAGGAWRLGVSPLSWTNDVLEELGGDIPVERCLGEAAAAGYEGVELGRKFPREADALRELLAPHGLALASGWHSGLLAERGVAAEIEAAEGHARLLAALGAGVLVYGECGRMAPGGAPLDAPLSARVTLAAAEYDGYVARLGGFARWLAGEHGLRLAYHHHLMMVVETFDEVSTLFDRAVPEVGLLLDTGHAAAAGFDYARLIERFGERIVHVHLKDVCGAVLRALRERDGSFNDGVRNGMFAVPGDGEVDLAPVARFVRESGYDGWLVVEAEGDPALVPPLAAVERGRARVLAAMGRGDGR